MDDMYDFYEEKLNNDPNRKPVTDFYKDDKLEIADYDSDEEPDYNYLSKEMIIKRI